MAFTEEQLRKRLAKVQDNMLEPMTRTERQDLADRLRELLPDGKSKKEVKENEAMMAAINVLEAKRKVMHVEMLTIYGDVIGALFTRPKKMDRHVHNLMSYVTLLVA